MKQSIYRELPYQFTDAELMVVAKNLSEKLREQETVETNKKTAVSQYDGQLKAVKSVINVLSENVRRGHEYRSIECTVYLDTPRKGFKQIVRNDTWETVSEEHMDYGDRQFVMEWEQEHPNPLATPTVESTESASVKQTEAPVDEQPAETPADPQEPAQDEASEVVGDEPVAEAKTTLLDELGGE